MIEVENDAVRLYFCDTRKHRLPVRVSSLELRPDSPGTFRKLTFFDFLHGFRVDFTISIRWLHFHMFRVARSKAFHRLLESRDNFMRALRVGHGLLPDIRL